MSIEAAPPAAGADVVEDRGPEGDGPAVSVVVFSSPAALAWPLVRLEGDDVVALGASFEVVDADAEPERAEAAGVVVVPTVIVSLHGTEVRRLMGAMTAAGILETISGICTAEAAS